MSFPTPKRKCTRYNFRSTTRNQGLPPTPPRKQRLLRQVPDGSANRTPSPNPSPGLRFRLRTTLLRQIYCPRGFWSTRLPKVDNVEALRSSFEGLVPRQVDALFKRNTAVVGENLNVTCLRGKYEIPLSSFYKPKCGCVRSPPNHRQHAEAGDVFAFAVAVASCSECLTTDKFSIYVEQAIASPRSNQDNEIGLATDDGGLERLWITDPIIETALNDTACLRTTSKCHYYKTLGERGLQVPHFVGEVDRDWAQVRPLSLNFVRHRRGRDVVKIYTYNGEVEHCQCVLFVGPNQE